MMPFPSILFLLLSAAQVGAVDCSGKAERFCVRQGVQEFPGVMIAIDGKTTHFDGRQGGSRVACVENDSRKYACASMCFEAH